jgi:hypothetical protein
VKQHGARSADRLVVVAGANSHLDDSPPLRRREAQNFGLIFLGWGAIRKLFAAKANSIPGPRRVASSGVRIFWAHVSRDPAAAV